MGGPLAQKVGSTTRYYLGDQHGDTVGWTDTTGTLKGTALYDPWGQVLSATGEMASVPAQGAFGFQSDLTDPSTGQVDMGVRAYEPTLGRFSSPDPLFGDPASPPSLNRFTYAVGNPVTLSDPTGLMPVCGEGCTRQEEARIIKDYAASFTQAGASEYSPAVSGASPPAPTVGILIATASAVAARIFDFVSGITGADLAFAERMREVAIRNTGNEVGCIGAAGGTSGRKDEACPAPVGYFDFNMTANLLVAATGGFIVSEGRIRPYAGIGVALPVGFGGSFTWSRSSPTEGLTIGLQGQAGGAGQVGRSFGECGGGFTEVGGGWPPGLSATAYVLGPPVEPLVTGFPGPVSLFPW